MSKHLIILFFSIFQFTLAQPNCFIYDENSPERKACNLCYKAIEEKQGSKASQLLFDEAIAIAPNFDWAYYEKSVPYFKRGFLKEGQDILNKAVALKPLDYLCYRAYWYWQYKNYELCIKDLETFYALPKSYFQTTPGGEKNMKIILGLAYGKMGNYEKGIKIIEDFIKSYDSESDIDLTDYHSLGLLYFFDKQYNKAITAFKNQITIFDDVPDTYYFLGLAHKAKSETNLATTNFQVAYEKYTKPGRFININAGFKVYKSDIEQELIH